MHPRARGLADTFLNHVDERGDVVIGDALAFVHRVDVEAGALADRARVCLRNHAELRPRLDREDLDLEPRPEARLVREEVGDLGERVARDHWCPDTAASAMSRR